MPYADSQGCQIFYQQHGSGAPVVLLRGIEQYDDTEKDLKEFAEHFHVTVYDKRGAGKSGPYTTKGNMKILVDDLISVLDDSGIDKAYIVGVSSDGLLAQSFCHANPERVAGLILVSSGVGPSDPAFIHPDKRVLDVVKLKWELEDIKSYLSDHIHKMYPKEEEREFSDFEDKLMGRLGHQESFAAHQAYLEACFERNDYSTKLQDIKVPVLIMHGKQDNVWPVDNAIYLSHHIRGSKLELFEQIGADLFNEHESLVINKIAEFVNA